MLTEGRGVDVATAALGCQQTFEQRCASFDPAAAAADGSQHSAAYGGPVSADDMAAFANGRLASLGHEIFDRASELHTRAVEINAQRLKPIAPTASVTEPAAIYNALLPPTSAGLPAAGRPQSTSLRWSGRLTRQFTASPSRADPGLAQLRRALHPMRGTKTPSGGPAGPRRLRHAGKVR